jgi:23S rRNA pseudouridine1911/1915/1917 synthase
MELDILFEDNHIIVVNKRPGVLVQGDQTGDKPLVEMLKDYIAEKYQKPGNVFAGVVHRIDRPVSGVVIFARTSKALERLNAQFRERKVEKIYWALVNNQPAEEEGVLVHWLSKNSSTNVTKAYHYERNDALRSELAYRLISKTPSGFSLLEVKPITGRSHQIRVQLASMGCPIAGDVKYGAKRANSDASICLHARRLIIEHPVKKEKLVFTAPAPDFGPWKGLMSF